MQVQFAAIPDSVVETLVAESATYGCAGGLMVEHPLVSPLITDHFGEQARSSDRLWHMRVPGSVMWRFTAGHGEHWHYYVPPSNPRKTFQNCIHCAG